jgi:hypothetical protein
MSVGLDEIETHWSICDVWDANQVLDEIERAEEVARDRA